MIPTLLPYGKQYRLSAYCSSDTMVLVIVKVHPMIRKLSRGKLPPSLVHVDGSQSMCQATMKFVMFTFNLI
jgi:hypothetical protein